MKGVVLNFSDKKNCSRLSEYCKFWDSKSEEIENVEEIKEYWNSRVQEIKEIFPHVLIGNSGNISFVASSNEGVIKEIDNKFEELELEEIDLAAICNNAEQCLVN